MDYTDITLHNLFDCIRPTKTEDLVKKRSVRKIVSVEERLQPFGQISILNEQNSVVTQTVQNETTSTEIQSVSPPPLAKVELSSGSEHTIRMLNVGPTGTMALIRRY